jgi:hypothetical protein
MYLSWLKSCPVKQPDKNRLMSNNLYNITYFLILSLTTNCELNCKITLLVNQEGIVINDYSQGDDCDA